jgi:cobalt-zinc-cadmium efflux system protein
MNRLVIAIGLNVLIVLFEVSFGFLTGSMALLADALHNITDIGSMFLSLWGVKVAARPSTTRKTYGYKRAEIIIAFVNGGVLLAVVGFILIKSVQRLFSPMEVAGMQMLIVAAVALLGNGLATYILGKEAHGNLNLKSAWLHSLQDALFSLGVIVGAIMLTFTGWQWIDPAISIVLSLFLLKEIFEILSESVHMLLDSVPEDLDFEEVKTALLSLEHMKSVDDLHIWQTGSHDRFLSAHLTVTDTDGQERTKLLMKAQSLLRERFRIGHTTLQMITAKEAEFLMCEHCN